MMISMELVVEQILFENMFVDQSQLRCYNGRCGVARISVSLRDPFVPIDDQWVGRYTRIHFK